MEPEIYRLFAADDAGNEYTVIVTREVHRTHMHDGTIEERLLLAEMRLEDGRTVTPTSKDQPDKLRVLPQGTIITVRRK